VIVGLQKDQRAVHARDHGFSSQRCTLSAAAYAGMFVFGIVMALLGAVLPSLMGRLHLKTSDIGTLFLAMNAAMLASSLVFGIVMDRFGMKSSLVLGPLLVATALGIVARATNLFALLFAASLLVIGGGALNGATKYTDRGSA
jgi:FHS family glucose/mannose:H+ symporter-like MFS transporter